MKSLLKNIKIKDFYNQFAQLEKTISKLNNANTFFDDLERLQSQARKYHLYS